MVVVAGARLARAQQLPAPSSNRDHAVISLDTAGHDGLDQLSSADKRRTRRGELSARQLNVMRIGYLVMGAGLAIKKWPMLIDRQGHWPLYEGVTTYMLVAMGLLALLGLRYPVKMLPILLFESAWKLAWLTAVALPLWIDNRLAPATSEQVGAILWVVVVLAVIPWRYTWREYIRTSGDTWGSAAPKTVHG